MKKLFLLSILTLLFAFTSNAQNKKVKSKLCNKKWEIKTTENMYSAYIMFSSDGNYTCCIFEALRCPESDKTIHNFLVGKILGKWELKGNKIVLSFSGLEEDKNKVDFQSVDSVDLVEVTDKELTIMKSGNNTTYYVYSASTQ